MTDTLQLILSAVLGSVLGGGALYKIVVSALENHMAQKFETRESAKEACDDIERTEKMCIMLSERVGSAEVAVKLLEERQTLQAERISEQLETTARAMRDVMKEVRAVSDMQHQLALRMERMQRGD